MLEKTLTREDLLELIGNPTNETLRHFHRLLSFYGSFTESELTMIRDWITTAKNQSPEDEY